MSTPLPQAWETDVLNTIGAPVTPQNIQNLDVWQKVEGGSTGNPDSYNPFNTTLPGAGSHPTNSVGVQAFPNWPTGLHATAATIEQRNMAPILAALRGNMALPQFEAAVSSTPWGTHFGSSTPQQATLTGGISIPSPVVPGGIPVPGFIVNPLEHLGGNVASDFIKQIVSSGLVIRSTLVVTGLIILFIGLSQLSKGGNSPTTTVVEGATTTSKHIGRATKTATEAAVAE